MVLLVEQGWAEQVEVAKAFDCTARTVGRCRSGSRRGAWPPSVAPGDFPKAGPVRVDLAHVWSTGCVRRGDRTGRSRSGSGYQSRRCGSCCGGWAGRRSSIKPSNCRWKPTRVARTRAREVRTQTVRSAPLGSCQRGTRPLRPRKSRCRRRSTRTAATVGTFGSSRIWGCSMMRPALPGGSESHRCRRASRCARPGRERILEVAREIYGSIGPAFYGLRTTIVALVS
jgi:hypothetical protein